jgi:hypothetical protein
MTVVVAGATAASLVTSTAQWLGSWGETGAALEDATIIGYPIAAGLAAWQFSAPKRQRFVLAVRASSRSRFELEGRSVLALGISAALGALAPGALALLLTGLHASYGHPPRLPTFVALLGYLPSVALGALAASILPSFFAAAASAVLLYVLQIFGDSGDPALSFLAGVEVADSRERTYRETAMWMLSLRGVLIICVAIAFVAIAARKSRIAGAAAAAVCLVSSPLLFVGADGMSVSSSALQAKCQSYSDELRVCMTAARFHTADTVAKYASTELGLLDGISADGTTLEEIGLTHSSASILSAGGHLTIPFEVANGVYGEAHTVSRGQLLTDISTAILRGNCGPDRGSEFANRPKARPVDVIQYWMMRKLAIPTDGSGSLGAPAVSPDILDYSSVTKFQQAWDALDSTQRRNWIGMHRDAIIQCNVSSSDLG